MILHIKYNGYAASVRNNVIILGSIIIVTIFAASAVLASNKFVEVHGKSIDVQIPEGTCDAEHTIWDATFKEMLRQGQDSEPLTPTPMVTFVDCDHLKSVDEDGEMNQWGYFGILPVHDVAYEKITQRYLSDVLSSNSGKSIVEDGIQQGAKSSEKVLNDWGIEMKLGDINSIGIFVSNDVAHIGQFLMKLSFVDGEQLVLGAFGVQLIRGRICYMYLYQEIDGEYTINELSERLYRAMFRMLSNNTE